MTIITTTITINTGATVTVIATVTIDTTTTTIITFTTNFGDRFTVVESGGWVMRSGGTREIDANISFIEFLLNCTQDIK